MALIRKYPGGNPRIVPGIVTLVVGWWGHGSEEAVGQTKIRETRR